MPSCGGALAHPFRITSVEKTARLRKKTEYPRTRRLLLKSLAMFGNS
jgi:hypothetical protein